MAKELKNTKNEVVQCNGSDVWTSDLSDTALIKGVDLKKRTLTIIGSDETKDRDGDIISVSGWQLENYLKNPVFQWAHNYTSPPIGRAITLVRRRSPARLEFVIRFPSEGVYPFADMILAMYNERIMNASSVGFIPRTWEDLPIDKEEQGGYRRARKYTKQELLELSAVPVPANPSALQNAIKDLKLSKDYQKTAFDILTGQKLFVPENAEMILEELGEAKASLEDDNILVQVQDDFISSADSLDDSEGKEEVIESCNPVLPELIKDCIQTTIKVEIDEQFKQLAEEVSSLVIEKMMDSLLVTDTKTMKKLIKEDGAQTGSVGDAIADQQLVDPIKSILSQTKDAVLPVITSPVIQEADEEQTQLRTLVSELTSLVESMRLPENRKE